jgi:hypothetical protein
MLRWTCKLGFLAALGFGVVISASGQGRGFSAPMRGFSRPVGGMSRLGRPGGFRRGFIPPPLPLSVSLHFPPVNGVPGLGFDFTHLAVVGAGFPRRFRFANRGFFPSFTPVFFGPTPYYPFELPYSGAGQQPIIIVVPSQPQQPQPAAPPPVETVPESASPQTSPPPPPELGQLILVRHDGQVHLAVGFTVRNGQITYITNDGTRRSFPVSDLDKQATRQMNDTSGTSVSLSE